MSVAEMLKKDAWKKLRDEMNRGIVSGRASPLCERLDEGGFSPEIARKVEHDICLAFEMYETFDIEEEKERYPRINKLAEELSSEIEKTFNLKVWCAYKWPKIGRRAFLIEEIKAVGNFAGELSSRYPPRRRWKERGRAPTLAYNIAKILDAHGIKPTNYGIASNRAGKESEGKFHLVLRAVFEASGLPCKDLRRRVINRALERLEEKKAHDADIHRQIDEARKRAAITEQKINSKNSRLPRRRKMTRARVA